MYKEFEYFIESNKEKINIGIYNSVQESWIENAEKKLGFGLPSSYKWFLKRYEFIDLGFDSIKVIAPPEFSEFADVDIVYTYKINLENGIMNVSQLCVLENEEESYYFLVDLTKEDHEYPVYRRDFINNDDILFAENFLEFIKEKIHEL